MLAATPAAGAANGAAAAGGHRPGVATATAASRTDNASTSPEAPVVLIGMSGVQWSDVSSVATPALWSLTEGDSLAAVAVRGVRGSACPADGWLTLSAGRRAADQPGRTCRTLTDALSGSVPHWDDYLDAATFNSYGAVPGSLGDALATAGVTVAAIGPGAAIAAARTDGRPSGSVAPLPYDTERLTSLVSDTMASADLLVLDLGSVRDPGYASEVRAGLLDVGGANDESGAGPVDSTDVIADRPREPQVQAIDDRLAAVLNAVTSTGTNPTVLIVSLADSSRPALQLAAAHGPDGIGGSFDLGLLTSATTRQDGLIQTVDVTATLAELFDLSSLTSTTVGAALRHTAASSPDDTVVDIARQSAAIGPVASKVTTVLIVAAVLLTLLAGLSSQRWLPRPVVRLGALAVAALPGATFAAGALPWWRADHPAATYWITTGAIAAAVAVIAVAGPWRRTSWLPSAVVAGWTVLLLVGDLVAGTGLVVDTPLGAHRLVAARFYGASNQSFALLAAAGPLLAAAVAAPFIRRARRLLGAAAVGAVGLVVTAADGLPGLGTDFGGPPALIPAFAALAIVVAGTRVRRRTLLMVGGVAVALVAAVTVGDWLRPAADRTHLGRFVQTVVDGGFAETVGRKAATNLRVLHSWRYLTLTVAGAATVVTAMLGVLGRPSRRWWDVRQPDLAWPAAVLASLLALVIGVLVNDSGIVITATGLVLLGGCALAWLVGSPQRPRATAVAVEGPATVSAR